MGNLVSPEQWAVTMFSFTNELLLAEKTPVEILSEAANRSLARHFEIDGPQHFHNFPKAPEREIEELIRWMAEHQKTICTVGGYADRALGSEVLRSSASVVDLVAQQLELAARLGAQNLRLQADALSYEDASLLYAKAEKFGVSIVFELQGSMTPDAPISLECLRIVRDLKSPNIRLMFDTSLFMRAFPPSFRLALLKLGLSSNQIELLERLWLQKPLPDFRAKLIELISAGELPPQLQSVFPTLLSRFGHSGPHEWADYAPYVDYVHLKFWDDSNENDHLSEPIRETVMLLSELGFEGYYCAEWGGHDWLSIGDASAAEMVASLKMLCLS